MCEPALDLKLCSCEGIPIPIIHNQNSRKHKKQFSPEEYLVHQLVWTLYKYIGKEDSEMMGMMFMPEDKIGNILTAELVLDQLNRKNCFDFEYNPQEGDNLIIHFNPSKNTLPKKDQHKAHYYMSFIFKAGNWHEDIYDAFSDKTEKFNSGKLNLNYPQNPRNFAG